MQLLPIEYILIASTLLEFNPLLQTVKSIRTKRAKDISPFTFILISITGALWLYYGITIGSMPLIIGNTIKLFTSLSVIVIYLKYKNR